MLDVGAMSQNVIKKSDQLVVYASRLLNITKNNYNTTKRKVLAMVFCNYFLCWSYLKLHCNWFATILVFIIPCEQHLV
jgi:hypothetical protein